MRTGCCNLLVSQQQLGVIVFEKVIKTNSIGFLSINIGLFLSPIKICLNKTNAEMMQNKEIPN
jgi:hypothetical protein